MNRIKWIFKWIRQLIFGILHRNNGVKIYSTSIDLADNLALQAILGYSPIFHSRLVCSHADVYLGWGLKWSGRRAEAIAGTAGAEFRLLEDGFLCSVEREKFGLSLIFDDKGIYYDVSRPSSLEDLVAESLSKGEEARCQAITNLWCDLGLSKYNAMRDQPGVLQSRYVLVCDQTFGDASISYGLASTKSFARMLELALAEYPDHTIILKTHPDVVMRGKKGHFDLAALANNDRIQVSSDPVHPSKLIEHADAVYTVTSQMGFEALIWGKRVRCFGLPFYAGWGLTEDELTAPDRRKPVSLEQLVHAALVKYPRYIDPVTMQLCEPEVTFRHVGLQRRKRQEFPEKITAVGFSRWKRPFISSFLQGSSVTFVKNFSNLPQADQPQNLAVWGSAALPDAHETSVILRIEDGFLRSSGLGADLVRPLSLVIDDVGIYYDATRASRLEQILQSAVLDARATVRAQALRERLVALDLTKYNLGKLFWKRPKTNQRVVLVVGQVETDASIRLGSPDVRSNIELLRRVRHDNPYAYIIYKPHPDVIAGLRKRGKDEDECSKIADEVISQPVALGRLLSQIDEVHTMTSLLGFEALIRGVKVVCHGLPFYAGWGLTEDRISCSRRTRRLTVVELVHGALISYPRYFNYERDCFVEPEHAVEQLAAMANGGPQRRSLHRKILRSAILAWLKLKGNTR